jgi:3-oxoadipate CoA-transferase, alpha subunit
VSERLLVIDKRIASIAAAMRGIPDGATVLLGGFGMVGHPTALIQGLVETGAKDLTIVANNAGFDREPGLPQLMALRRIRKLVCSFPKGSPVFDELFRAGSIELEIVPQGTLAERIRAAGAGIPAFFTRTSVGTQLGAGKECRDFNGDTYVLERALFADVALVEAWRADRWGNLSYRGSGRNFNPVMATAAALTIAQVDDFVELGGLSPDAIGTPGIYVDRVVKVPSTSQPMQ